MVKRRAARWALKQYHRYHNTSSVSSSNAEQTPVSHPFIKYTVGKLQLPSGTLIDQQSAAPGTLTATVLIPLSTTSASHRLSFYSRTTSQWSNIPHSFFYRLFFSVISSVYHKPKLHRNINQQNLFNLLKYFYQRPLNPPTQ